MYYIDPFCEIDTKFKEARKKEAAKYSQYTYNEYMQTKQKWLKGQVDKINDMIKENKEDRTLYKFRYNYMTAAMDYLIRLKAKQQEKEDERYFIEDKNLAEFLKSTKVNSLKYLAEELEDKEFYVYTESESLFFKVLTDKETEDVGMGYVEEKILYIISNKFAPIIVPLYFEGNPEDTTKWLKEEAKVFKRQNKDQEEKINTMIKRDIECFRMAMNLMFYVKAFPDAVREGLPMRIAHNQKKDFKGIETRTITIDDGIITERNEKAPHFRSGYFMYFKNDRYKKMKGKCVFVEPTFVKGKGKIINNEF